MMLHVFVGELLSSSKKVNKSRNFQPLVPIKNKIPLRQSIKGIFLQGIRTTIACDYQNLVLFLDMGKSLDGVVNVYF